jgi:C4-dicarboxylate-specific signal transduction histidine kinase
VAASRILAAIAGVTQGTMNHIDSPLPEIAGNLPLSQPIASNLRWLEVGAEPGLVLAVVLVCCVALLDYVTGYEVRLAILYLLPIALSTWSGGPKAGMLIVAAASLCWLVSFRSSHTYSGEVFFYWEGLAMFSVYVAIVWLLARLRAALRRADERFLRVLEELHAGVYVLDHDRAAIAYANRRLGSMLGVEASSLRASELEQRFGAAPAACYSVPPAHAGTTHTVFVSAEVRDKATGRWYLVQSGPVPWTRNRRVTLRVITDISEQKHAASLRQQHRDMLYRTARLAALAEIASTLAHEVNQPLMAIASYTDACLRLLAQPRPDDGEVVGALEKCRRQAVRAGAIISRMREFIRSRHPHPRACDVNTVIRESLDLVDVHIEEVCVNVEVAVADDLPPIHADPTLLVQVVVNLLQNAIDAMRGCPLSQRTCTVATRRNGDGAILVSVADRGCGLPEGSGDDLYRPFFTTKPQGLGLGLSICRSVVEAHGGDLWHEATPGGGCTFHFTVPATRPA